MSSIGMLAISTSGSLLTNVAASNLDPTEGEEIPSWPELLSMFLLDQEPCAPGAEENESPLPKTALRRGGTPFMAGWRENNVTQGVDPT